MVQWNYSVDDARAAAPSCKMEKLIRHGDKYKNPWSSHFLLEKEDFTYRENVHIVKK